MRREEIFNEVLSRLCVVQGYKDKAQCRCPAHNDKHASLSVAKGRKGVLLYCHAGCDLRSILQKIGMETRELYYE